jgi:hypothetical protein
MGVPWNVIAALLCFLGATAPTLPASSLPRCSTCDRECPIPGCLRHTLDLSDVISNRFSGEASDCLLWLIDLVGKKQVSHAWKAFGMT